MTERGGRRAGILGVGLYAPPEVRRNSWWPSDAVARWAAQRREAPAPPVPAELGAGARRVLRAQLEQAGDPFLGTSERRVLAADRTIEDMEIAAARDALTRARVDPADVDLLLTHTVVPDYMMANPACSVHESLGLSRSCLALETEATAYTPLAQLALADAMIAAGRARHALLVQACVGTRLIDADEPASLLMGDAASAIVVGPVSSARGVLAQVSYTDGRYPRSLIMSVRDRRWYDDGRVRMHIGDPRQLFEAQLQIADTCADSVVAALARSGHSLDEVDHLCVFQGTPWIQRVVFEQLGARLALPADIFQRYGYLSSVAIPAQLYTAVEAGALAEDDLVVVAGGGTGMTYGAAVLRWGAA